MPSRCDRRQDVFIWRTDENPKGAKLFIPLVLASPSSRLSVRDCSGIRNPEVRHPCDRAGSPKHLAHIATEFFCFSISSKFSFSFSCKPIIRACFTLTACQLKRLHVRQNNQVCQLSSFCKSFHGIWMGKLHCALKNLRKLVDNGNSDGKVLRISEEAAAHAATRMDPDMFHPRVLMVTRSRRLVPGRRPDQRSRGSP